jgi:serine/threonine protein kinase/TPR repeat protein
MKTCPQCDTGYPDSQIACPIHGHLLNEIRELKPGMVIHKTYRIVRKLGQGGMGTVYLAQHIQMGEPRALKFLSPELSRDQAFTARFLREVRMLRQIRNRNVVDCGDLEAAEDDSLFFSMEFVDGPDLRAFLRDPFQYLNTDCHPERSAAESKDLRLPLGALPVPLALSIARQIAEGLGAAHSKGMVHRDIKPENILMARDAGVWLPKIADFGIVATKESSTAYTRTGGTLLTMAYAAPEQWRGTPAASLDGRTDLYALGGLLYEMLTGQTAFHAENYEGWSRQHQTTPPSPPSALRPELANWQGLDALVLRLLAKDRNHRPKDVAELVNLLDMVQYIAPEVQRETVKDRLRPIATELLRGKGFRRVSRWLWITSVTVIGSAILIAGLAFSLPTTTIAKRANEFDKAEHYDLGRVLRNLACMRGDGEACFHLGLMYQEGNGVAVNDSRAVAYYTKSCEMRHGQSCANLAFIYGYGSGVVEDDSRAATFFSKACDIGNADGCFQLGWLYDAGFMNWQFGKGIPDGSVFRVERDYLRSAAFYSKACNAGSAESCYNLAEKYASGYYGPQQDFSRAAEFYDKACYFGYARGCSKLAIRYQYGVGVGREVWEAKKLYTKACTMGDESACGEAAKLQ